MSIFSPLAGYAKAQGVALASIDVIEFSKSFRVPENPEFLEYLSNYLPTDSYVIAGGELRVHPPDRIISETSDGARPGSIVCPFGFLPFGSSIGGNLVCFSTRDNTIRWADHSYVSDVFYLNKLTEDGKLATAPINEENLDKYLPIVADSFSKLLQLETEQKLRQIIEELDCS